MVAAVVEVRSDLDEGERGGLGETMEVLCNL